MIDIFEYKPELDPKFEEWVEYQPKLRRMFSVMSYDENQLFILTLGDLHRMKTDYIKMYDELFDCSFMRVQKMTAIKSNAMKIC